MAANGRVLNDVSYCVWNAFQVVFIYFIFPETSGRTLEELAFCKCVDALAEIYSFHEYLNSV